MSTPAYEALLACWRSGQISPQQWEEHLRDPAFAQWIAAQWAASEALRPPRDVAGKQVGVAIQDNTVSLEILCTDAYEAEVLADDLIERLQSPDGLALRIRTTGPASPDQANG